MEPGRLQTIFGRYMQQTSTPAETQELLQYIADPSNEAEAREIAGDYWENMSGHQLLSAGESGQLYNSILNQIRPARIQAIRRWKLAAAAAVFLLVASAAFFALFRNHSQPVSQSVDAISKNDIAPGSNRAVLTLASGATIILDSAANGTLARQGNSRIVKTQNGVLAYQPSGASPKAAPSDSNTLSTPRGGQYRLTLPDGTQAWLNSSSSIRYPTTFTGNERNITITGEAYLEVAKDRSRPFRVTVGDMQVEVLGTHFNISAYSDEADISTTLLEGRVRVSLHGVTRTLAPGQQARATTQNISIAAADTAQVMAWKNGLFDFTNADLGRVMRQLSRWYDIQVRYPANIPFYRFQGQLPRDLNLSQVLRALGESEVKFRIEDHIVIIGEKK